MVWSGWILFLIEETLGCLCSGLCWLCWGGLGAMSVCGGFALQHLCCFPGLYFPELEAQESLAVTLMSLYNFPCDSLVTFPVKWSCLPKSLSAF